MAVTGWTEQPDSEGTRTWSGSEDTQIEPSSTGTYRGFLTRDANDGIGDFEFISEISTVSDTAITGGLIFGFQDYSQFYCITFGLYFTSTLYLMKDGLQLSSGTQLASYDINSDGTQDTTFRLKIKRSGNDIEVYYTDVGASFNTTPEISVTDTSYLTGNIGYGYPDNWTSNTDFIFTSVSSSKRRIFLIT